MTHEKRKASKLAETPPRFKVLALKVLEGRVTPRQAIKAKCLDCMGYIIKDIRNCPSTTCELHRFRPFQPPSNRGGTASRYAGKAKDPPVGTCIKTASRTPSETMG
jgi:hypothetical protein